MTAFRSKTISLLAGTAVAGGALLGAAVPAQAAQAAPAPAPTAAEAGVDASVNLDPVAIGQAIDDAVHDQEDRGGQVQAALDVGYWNEANPDRMTVAVVNKNQDIDVEGSVANAKDIDIEGGSYVIYWFNGPGKIVNNGDGGWLNWGARGAIDRVDENTISVNGG